MIPGKFLCYPSTLIPFLSPSYYLAIASGGNLPHVKDVEEGGPPLAQESEFHNTYRQKK